MKWQPGLAGKPTGKGSFAPDLALFVGRRQLTKGLQYGEVSSRRGQRFMHVARKIPCVSNRARISGKVSGKANAFMALSMVQNPSFAGLLVPRPDTGSPHSHHGHGFGLR